MEWIVVKSLLSLGAVILLMIGVVFVMKKYVYGRQSSSSQIVEMKVIGTLMIQPKRSVSVIKVMDKILVIGLSEDGMQSLGEISDAKSLSRIDERLAGESAQGGWFTRKPSQSASVSFAEALKAQISKVATKGA
ncbi:hypothetical protein FBQ87_12440 [Sphingobacteriales bacterium CHB3]|nr:hypothetical protein [Sphingobacteriales bacterium CHB3]